MRWLWPQSSWISRSVSSSASQGMTTYKILPMQVPMQVAEQCAKNIEENHRIVLGALRITAYFKEAKRLDQSLKTGLIPFYLFDSVSCLSIYCKSLQGSLRPWERDAIKRGYAPGLRVEYQVVESIYTLANSFSCLAVCAGSNYRVAVESIMDTMHSKDKSKSFVWDATRLSSVSDEQIHRQYNYLPRLAISEELCAHAVTRRVHDAESKRSPLLNSDGSRCEHVYYVDTRIVSISQPQLVWFPVYTSEVQSRLGTLACAIAGFGKQLAEPVVIVENCASSLVRSTGASGLGFLGFQISSLFSNDVVLSPDLNMWLGIAVTAVAAFLAHQGNRLAPIVDRAMDPFYHYSEEQFGRDMYQKSYVENEKRRESRENTRASGAESDASRKDRSRSFRFYKYYTRRNTEYYQDFGKFWKEKDSQERSNHDHESNRFRSRQRRYERSYDYQEQDQYRYQSRQSSSQGFHWHQQHQQQQHHQHPSSSSSVQEAYTILDLRQNASVQEIKKSFHKLALKHHPDRHLGKASDAKFKQISSAYQLLLKHHQQHGGAV